MKKLFSLLVVSAFMLVFASSTHAANGNIPQSNAAINYYNPRTKDLIMRPENFPAYFLVNLKNSKCPNFTVNEKIFFHSDKDSKSITQISTGKTCMVESGFFEIQGGTSLITSVNMRHKSLEARDEGGNTWRYWFGEGCQHPTVGEMLFFGTGWQENSLILSGAREYCSIKGKETIKRHSIEN